MGDRWHQRERTGPTLPNVAPSNIYPAKDGNIVLIAANQDTVFARLAALIGRPELARDDRFATHGARGANMAELDNLIAEWSSRYAADDLLQRLHEAGVPAGRIYTAKDMLSAGGCPEFRRTSVAVPVIIMPPYLLD